MAGARALPHNAGFGRARCVACACCYARRQPRLLGRRKGGDALLGRATGKGRERGKEGVSGGSTERQREGRGGNERRGDAVLRGAVMCVCVCVSGFAAAARAPRCFWLGEASLLLASSINSRSLPSKSLHRKSESLLLAGWLAGFRFAEASLRAQHHSHSTSHHSPLDPDPRLPQHYCPASRAPRCPLLSAEEYTTRSSARVVSSEEPA